MDKKLQIEILANTKQAIEDIKKLENEIKKFSDDVKKGNVDLKRQETQLTSLAGSIKKVVSAYMGFQVARSAINIVADFEQSIAKLGAISGASKENLDKLKQKAEELGKSTMFSASEVAEGMNYLAMAGYKTKDIIASIGDVLNLAAVGQIDLGRASDIASNILSGFNLKAEETKRVVDVMTATITNANTNIPEMGEAMKYVAPQARALGVSLEETATAIGVLSNSGIKATMAGTGLSTMLVRLASPTGAAKDAIDELGIKIYDANGKFVGLTEVLKQFKDKMANMSQEMKAKYMRDIFGLETMKTAITLIDSVGNSYDELYSKIAKSMGVTEEKVKQMTDTFNGHMKELESAFQGLIITIGNELLPALTDFVKWLTESVNATEKFYNENKTLINTIVELTAVFIALSKVRAIIEGVLGAKAAIEITKTTLSIKKLKQAVTMLTGALMKLGKANIAVMALTLAIEGLNYAFDKWEEKIKKLDESTNKLKTSTKSFNEIMQTLQKSMKIDENGHKTFKLTREEIEKLKKETEDLIKTNEKRIKQLKEESNGSAEYKNMIAVLEGQNKTLQATLKKLSTLKPYEKTAKSAENAEKSVEKLTKEQEKYLKSLDKRLQKEQTTTKSILELKNEEIEKARALLGETKYFEEAKAKIIEYYNLKEIRQFKDTYTKRIQEHENTIEKLKSKEYDLAKKIEEIQTQLNNRLKQLETEKLNAIEDIENKIHNLKMSAASSYEQYIDKQKQAEIRLAKAKEAIRNGDLAQAKRYMSQYESLMTSLANTEIKENGKVIVSKKQANAVAIEGLKELENLTNEYYAKAKAQEEAAARAKIQNLKTELEAIKAQLQIEVQRLNLEKQLIETLTGKKVDIDTSAALESIKNLDAQIKQLDEKLKQKKDIKVDTNKAKAELKKVENTKTKVKVEADTKPVLAAVMEVTDKVTGKKEVIKFYANTKEPEEKLKKVNLKAKNLKPTVKVKSDISQALNKLSQIPKTITTIHYIKTVETHATGGIAGFRKVQGKIPGDDPLNSDDVPALLTRGEFVVKRDAVKHYGEDFLYRLNNKLLPRFATGGLVEIGRPQKLITQLSDMSGSSSNFDLEHIKVKFDVDLSIVDELRKSIEKLGKFLKEAFPTPSGALEDNGSFGIFTKKYNGLKNEVEQKSGEFKGEVEKDKKEVKKKEKEINSEVDKAAELSLEIERIKESLKGSVLQENEYKTISSKLNNMQKQFNFLLKDIEIKKEKLDSFVESAYEKIEQKEKELSSYENKIYGFEEKVRDYLEKVEETKYEIKDKISKLGAEDKLTDRFEKSTNLKELSSYLKTLQELPSVEEIKNKIKQNLKQEMERLKPRLEWAAKRYYTDPLLAPDFLKLQAKYEELNRLYNNNTLLEKKAKEELLAKIPKFATGGLIKLQNGGKLPGYGGGDRNLALLEDGEFVIRKEAVRTYGTDLFEKLNNFKLPKFATGGIVGDLPSANNGSGDTVNVNFKFPDGANFEMQSDEMTAKQLASYFKRMM